jgi:hypothetical protein
LAVRPANVRQIDNPRTTLNKRMILPSLRIVGRHFWISLGALRWTKCGFYSNVHQILTRSVSDGVPRLRFGLVSLEAPADKLSNLCRSAGRKVHSFAELSRAALLFSCLSEFDLRFSFHPIRLRTSIDYDSERERKPSWSRRLDHIKSRIPSSCEASSLGARAGATAEQMYCEKSMS